MKTIFFLLLTLLPHQDLWSQNSSSYSEQKKVFKRSLRKLNNGKSIKKNKALLQSALQSILLDRSKTIEELKSSNNLKDKETALEICSDLQKKIADSRQFLANMFTKEYDLLKEESILLSNDLVTGYLQRGQTLLMAYKNTNIKSNAKKAYFDFRKSQEYGNASSDLDELLDYSREQAQLIYVVQSNDIFALSHSWEIDRQLEDLNNSNLPFKTIHYNPSQNIADADCEIQIDFNSLDFDEEDNSEELEFSKKVVVGTKTITNNAGEEVEVEEFEEVQGKVIIEKWIRTASWEVDFNVVRGNKNCDTQPNSFEEEYISEKVKIELEGDERAIPNRYQAKEESYEESESDVAEQLIMKIYQAIENQLN